MKKIFFSIILICNLCYSQLRVELKLLSSERVIKCEPVYIEVRWGNEGGKPIKVGDYIKPLHSDALYFLINGEEIKIKRVVKDLLDPNRKRELLPKEYISESADIKNLLRRGGKFIIKAVADLRRAGIEYEGGISQSNEIEVIVEEPEGVDYLIYEESMERCMKKGKECTREIEKVFSSLGSISKVSNECAEIWYMFDEKELLEKYPTSTYAGWVFGSPGYAIEWQSGKQIIENLLKTDEEKKKDGVFVDKEKAVKFIRFSEQFLNSNSNHINAGLIYFRKAIAHLVLHQWEEAYEAAKKSLDYEWPLWFYSAHPPTREKQRKAMEGVLKEIKERKLVRKRE